MTPSTPAKELAETIYIAMFGNIAMDVTQEVLEVIASALEEAQKNHEHNSLCEGCCKFTSGFYEAMKQAVAAERDRCAKLVEKLYWDARAQETEAETWLARAIRGETK